MSNEVVKNNGNFAIQQIKENNSSAEMQISRQAAEVQAAMVIAKKFPRDEEQSFSRIMKACSRLSLAETAAYEYPRGGQKVTGPSIRLAEVMARAWGNIDYGILELENKNGESQVMAYAWDLETNTRQTKVFAVKHERKAQGQIKRLDDPRDIYEMVANQGARRVRACILGIIPGDITDAAISQCDETIQKGEKEPLSDRIRKMLVVFEKEYQVNQSMIETRFKCKAAALSEKDMLALRKIYNSLKDGMAKREDYFTVAAQVSKFEQSGANSELLELDPIAESLNGSPVTIDELRNHLNEFTISDAEYLENPAKYINAVLDKGN
jgi:hypothetical protein